MPARYKYKAIGPDGTQVEDRIIAENDRQVIEFLAEQSLIPVSVTEINTHRSFSIWGFFRGTVYENLIAFTANLATLYRAGIPLLRALSLVRTGPKDSAFNDAVRQIRTSLQGGKTLSLSMAEFDNLFPKYYIARVSAGEESGKLDDIFDELSYMLESELEMTRQIKSGIRYPAMVICALAAAFVVMMTFVVPRFVDFYGSFNTELPIFTRLLIAVSDIFARYWAIMLGVLVGAVFSFSKAMSHEKSRRIIDRFFLRLPVVGQLIIKGNVARFAMMFRILIAAGLPIVKTLDILVESVKNSQIAAEVSLMRELFEGGRDSQLSTGGFEFMPDMALQMITIGLESGSLEGMLGEIGKHYSREVNYTSKHLTSILEPILTLVLGIFVLVLALSIFLPMWNLIQVFSTP